MSAWYAMKVAQQLAEPGPNTPPPSPGFGLEWRLTDPAVGTWRLFAPDGADVTDEFHSWPYRA